MEVPPPPTRARGSSRPTRLQPGDAPAERPGPHPVVRTISRPRRCISRRPGRVPGDPRGNDPDAVPGRARQESYPVMTPAAPTAPTASFPPGPPALAPLPRTAAPSSTAGSRIAPRPLAAPVGAPRSSRGAGAPPAPPPPTAARPHRPAHVPGDEIRPARAQVPTVPRLTRPWRRAAAAAPSGRPRRAGPLVGVGGPEASESQI